jgi:hypothetical protein
LNLGRRFNASRNENRIATIWALRLLTSVLVTRVEFLSARLTLNMNRHRHALSFLSVLHRISEIIRKHLAGLTSYHRYLQTPGATGFASAIECTPIPTPIHSSTMQLALNRWLPLALLTGLYTNRSLAPSGVALTGPRNVAAGVSPPIIWPVLLRKPHKRRWKCRERMGATGFASVIASTPTPTPIHSSTMHLALDRLRLALESYCKVVTV